MKKSFARLFLNFLFVISIGPTFAVAGDEAFITESSHTTVNLNPDWTYVIEYEVTTLIREQSAIDSLGQDKHMYSADSEEVEVVEAFTILPNGERLMVTPDQIRTVEDENDDGVAQFSDDRYKVIVYPGLVPGARTYSKIRTYVHTPLYPGNFVFSDYYGPFWEYGDVTLTFNYPDSMNLHFFSRGFSELSSRDVSRQYNQVRYVLKNQSVELEEEGQVWYGDFSPAVFVSSFKDYAAFAEAYEERADPQVVIDEDIEALAYQLTEGIVDRREQAKAIYNWVAQNIRYVAIYMAAGGVVPHRTDEILKNRYGDCKDKSLLLIALLKVIGIDAVNAIISSGQAYELPPIPAHSPFNHVITYIPEFDVFVDPTLELSPFGVLSQGTSGKLALLSATGELRRTPVLSGPRDGYHSKSTVKLREDGYLEGRSQTSYFGEYESTRRYQLDFYDEDSKKEYVRAYFAYFREAGDGTLTFTDVRDLNTPLVTSSEFVLDPVSNVPGPGAFRIPVGLTPGDIEYKTYGSRASSRLFPMVCGAYTYQQDVDIELPDGTSVFHIPESIAFKRGAYTYEATYEQISPQLIRTRRHFYAIRDRVVCPPDEYSDWLETMEVIQRDVRSQVIYR